MLVSSAMPLTQITGGLLQIACTCVDILPWSGGTWVGVECGKLRVLSPSHRGPKLAILDR